MNSSSYNYKKIVDDEKEIVIGRDNDDDVYPTKEKGIRSGSRNNKKTWKRSCCLTSCLWVTLVLIVILLTGSIVIYKGIACQVRKWTVSKPYSNLLIVDVPESQLQVWRDEAKLFRDNILDDQSPMKKNDLILPAKNINGIIAMSDYLRGNAYLEIMNGKNQEEEVTVAVLTHSLPMNFFPGGSGRFFIGKIILLWDPTGSIFRLKMMIPPLDNEQYDDGIMITDRMKTFLDIRFHLAFQENDCMWNLMPLSGQFLDQKISQEFIDEHAVNVFEELVKGCDDDDHHHHCGCKDSIQFLTGIDGITYGNDQAIISARLEQCHLLEEKKNTIVSDDGDDNKKIRRRKLATKHTWTTKLVKHLFQL